MLIHFSAILIDFSAMPIGFSAMLIDFSAMLIEQRTHGLILLVRPDEVPAVQDPGRERWEWAVTGKPDQGTAARPDLPRACYPCQDRQK